MEKFPLHENLSPLSAVERQKLNENWRRIKSYLNNIQSQFNDFIGGEVEELIHQINETLDRAEVDANVLSDLITQVNQKITQVTTATTNATNAATTANTAASNANTARTNANNAASAANTAATNATTARDAANAAATAANNAKLQADSARDAATAAASAATNAATAANTSKTQADNARDAANSAAVNANTAATKAARDVLLAINAMQTDLETFKSKFIHLDTYQNLKQYYKNNEVIHMGSTFRAKKDTLGNPPPITFTSSEHWQLIARRGEDAPNLDDAIEVWRGPNPPTETRLIWWSDPNYTPGGIVRIYRSDVPPTDIKHLWLARRGEI